MAGALSPKAPLLANGRFAVVSRLSRGDASSTFLVDDRTADARRMLVLLDPKGLAPERRSRFEEGGRAMAAVRHPNVLRVLEGRKARRVPYLLLESVGGGTVAHALERTGPLDSATVARVALQLVGALAAAHGHGVVHHQVQPSSLWVATNGLIKLGEFELATPDGAPVPYERFPYRPKDATNTADPRSDLYGLGATLVSLLKGEVLDAWPDPEALPPGNASLLRIVRRCLAPADQRYPTADALLADLHQALPLIPDGGGTSLFGKANETPVDRSDADVMLAVDRPVGAPPPSAADIEAERDEDWLGSHRSTPTPAPAQWVTESPRPAPPSEETYSSATPASVGRTATPPTAQGRVTPALTPPPARTATPPPRMASPPLPLRTPSGPRAGSGGPLAQERTPLPSLRKTPGPSQEARFRVDPEVLRRRHRWWWVGTAVRALGGLALLGVVAAVLAVVAAGVGLYLLSADFQRTVKRTDDERAALYAVVEAQRTDLDLVLIGAQDGPGAKQSFLMYREATEPAKLQAALKFIEQVEQRSTAALEPGVTGEELERRKRLKQLQDADDAYLRAAQAWKDRADTWLGRLLIALRMASPPP